jgi:hypothetical protein
MSASSLLTPGSNKIDKAYLPVEATTTPTLAQVLVQGNDGDSYDINNIGNLRINDSEVSNTTGPLVLLGTGSALQGYPDPTVLIGGDSYLQINDTALRMFDANINMNAGTNVSEIIFDAKTGIWASNTTPDALELVATNGGTVVVSDKTNTGRVYDAYFNPPVGYKRFAGTDNTPSPGFAIPASNNANPGKTLATFDVSSLGTDKNSFQGYLTLSTGTVENPDSATISYEFFLSDTSNGAYDASKGVAIGLTGVLNDGTGGPYVYTVPVNLILENPATTIYLNIQALETSGGPVGGSTWTGASWTLDLYASTVIV